MSCITPSNIFVTCTFPTHRKHPFYVGAFCVHEGIFIPLPEQMYCFSTQNTEIEKFSRAVILVLIQQILCLGWNAYQCKEINLKKYLKKT